LPDPLLPQAAATSMPATAQTRYRFPAAAGRRLAAVAAVFVALAAGGLSVGAQQPEPAETPRRGETRANWDRDEHRVLRAAGPKDYDPPPPARDEKLDRVDVRKGGPGSLQLLDLLGLPRRDVILESGEKALKLEEGRQKANPNAEEGGALFTGLGFAPEEEPEEAAAQRPELGEEAPAAQEGEFRVVSSDFLEVDVEARRVFGAKRTRVTVGRYELTADRMVIDARLREARAFGNVLLRDLESGAELTAEWISFSFEEFVGRAGRVNGAQSGLYFIHDDLRAEPNFSQSNEREIVLRDTGVTGNDFPVPTYQVKGKEVVLFRDERFYILHAVVYLRGWPVAYLPVYTRSLRERSSWQFYFGSDSDDPHELGTFATLRYDYYYKYLEPDPLDDKEYRRRSFARWSPTLYYFEPAQGIGLDANYDYEYGKHKGRLFLFRTNEDDQRTLEGSDPPQSPVNPETGEPLFVLPAPDPDEEGDGERYAYRVEHRTELLPDLDLLFDIDWVSDSEVYYNYFDKFEEEARGRLSERSQEVSLTWRQDSFLARVLADERERISRNRVRNFQEPGDDDLDFEENPDNTMGFFLGQTEPFEEEPDITGLDPIFDNEPLLDGEEQINNRRFTVASRREPELNLTTNRIKLSTLPVYWTLDARAFRALDNGLNAFRDEDDTEVEGFDVYNSLSFTWNLGDNFTWHHQFGVGVGRAEREDDSWLVFEQDGLNYQPTIAGEPAELTFPATLNGIVFLDESTFLVGRDPVSLQDVDENFAYYDYQTEITKRFSEEWSSRIDYIYRDGTDDSLFETYEKIGRKNARGDIFDYRPFIHRVSASLDYVSSYPRLTASLIGGTNLQSEEDIYANEIRDFATLTGAWTTLDEEIALSGAVSWTNTQIRDPSDPFSYEQQGIVYLAKADYFPTHGLWWAQLEGSYVETLDEDPLGQRLRAELEADPELGQNLDEEDDGKNLLATGVAGFKVGPKWEIEFQAHYDDDKEDFDELSLIFLRDLYDAILLVELEWDLDLTEEAEEELENPNPDPNAPVIENEDRFEREFQINFGFGFRLPNSDRVVGSGVTETANLRRRPSEFELGG
jgi:hypothetical protein